LVVFLRRLQAGAHREETNLVDLYAILMRYTI
jgi:hypothetical protein